MLLKSVNIYVGVWGSNALLRQFQKFKTYICLILKSRKYKIVDKNQIEKSVQFI